jgi:hypothetical protein
MRHDDFTGKVMRVVRQMVPSGDVHAQVSRRFAGDWIDSLEVIDSDYQVSADIDEWPGDSDESGTLTYSLNKQLDAEGVDMKFITPDRKMAIIGLNQILGIN